MVLAATPGCRPGHSPGRSIPGYVTLIQHMIEVARFDTRAGAELARSLLAAAGIPCVLAPDEAPGAYPIHLSAGARLFVAQADAYDALAILGYQQAADEDRA